VVSKGFYNRKDLICCIIAVLLLLSVCMTVDYADDSISNQNESSIAKNVPSGAIVTNNSSIVAVKQHSSVIVPKASDKIHTIKPKYKTITMTGKPSCNKCARHCSYTWRTRTYINYCPHCHRYGTLGNKHKWQSRYEQEITCFHCDSDFCINCGKTKYSWSNVYLRGA